MVNASPSVRFCPLTTPNFLNASLASDSVTPWYPQTLQNSFSSMDLSPNEHLRQICLIGVRALRTHGPAQLSNSFTINFISRTSIRLFAIRFGTWESYWDRTVQHVFTIRFGLLTRDCRLLLKLRNLSLGSCLSVVVSGKPFKPPTSGKLLVFETSFIGFFVGLYIL